MADTTVPVPHVAEHNKHVRHHFATAEQQMDSATLGMWTFLITEVLFFGGMFAAYAVFRFKYPAAFASTSIFMNVKIGAANTAVLICSSLTMAMAVRASQLSKRADMLKYLFRYDDLRIDIPNRQGIRVSRQVRGASHSGSKLPVPRASRSSLTHAQLLFFLYFCMTGMHAIHMIVGSGPIGLAGHPGLARNF